MRRVPVWLVLLGVLARAVLGELRRVVEQRRRTPSVAATGQALGRSPGAIELRLRLIALLPDDALDGVPVPSLSAAESDRRRQAVLGAGAGARPDGVDEATLERWRRSVRGLAGGC